MNATPPPARVPDNRWDLLEQIATAGLAGTAPTVRIVVPVRDRQSGLDRLLAALHHQTHPARSMEVVVVDDHSEKPIDVGHHPWPVHLVRLVGPATSFGAGAARNQGAAGASTDVLVFLDSDVIPSRELVAAHARWHALASDVLSVGRVILGEDSVPSPDDLLRTAADELLSSVDPRLAPTTQKVLEQSQNLTRRRPDIWRIVAGANLAMRRTSFLALGGFRELGIRGVEDIEFGYRAFVEGMLLVPVTDATVWHIGSRHFDDPEKAARTKLARAPVIEALIPLPPVRALADALRSSTEAVGAWQGEVVPTVEVRWPADLDAATREALAQHCMTPDVGVIGFEPAAGRAGTAPILLQFYAPVHLVPGGLLHLVAPLHDVQEGLAEVVDEHGDVVVRAWSRRALARCTRVAPGTAPRLVVDELFVVREVALADVGSILRAPHSRWRSIRRALRARH